jgi:hypothetical protein
VPNPPTIQVKEICRLFDFDERQVRFILEQGFVPKGVERAPSTGNRREFGPGQAFCLVITVLLKGAGLKTPTAAEIAKAASEGLQQITQNFNWDRTFSPVSGWFETEYEYTLEVADGRCFRLQTTASPSKALEQFGWATLHPPRKKCPAPAALVTIRLDLKKIAAVFKTVDGWSCPHRKVRAT